MQHDLTPLTPADLDLSAMEQRLLGALMEKQVTVPASYPLSLNGLRTAANQSSSRDPVTDYDEPAIETCLRELKNRQLVRVVWAGKGSRTLKYHQLLTERLELSESDNAILTVLLLRAAQTAGELRTRTERMHAFDTKEDVEARLTELAQRGFVRQLDKRPGQHDRRWIHLLGEVAEGSAASAPASTSSVDYATVLDGGPAQRTAKVRTAYDVVAATYADRLIWELDDKPFDTWLLTRLAEAAGSDPLLEVGCGPGHVSAYLTEAGAEVTGLDLSPEMISQARHHFPEVTFEVGDFTALLRPPRAAAWGGIVAWYALVHLAPAELGGVLREFGRVVRPGGLIGVALHVGGEVRHLSEWWEHEVDLDVVLPSADAVHAAVTEAGLETVEWYLRGPLPGVEVETTRLYVLARVPS